jgi:hypothetical protein
MSFVAYRAAQSMARQSRLVLTEMLDGIKIGSVNLVKSEAAILMRE